jgi:hypothetical protein
VAELVAHWLLLFQKLLLPTAARCLTRSYNYKLNHLLLQVQQELDQARYELTQLKEELVAHGLTDQLLLLLSAAAVNSCQLLNKIQIKIKLCAVVVGPAGAGSGSL